MKKIYIIALLVAVTVLVFYSRHPSTSVTSSNADALGKTFTNKDGSTFKVKAFGVDGKEVAITNIQIK